MIARIKAGERIPEGHWLVADRQTAGKGRLDRKWLGGPGNFMGSTLVHLGHGDPDPSTLALVAGLAAFEAAKRYLPESAALHLKWPNDLIADGRKLAGILLERGGDAVVIGIGVNLANAPSLEAGPTAAIADFGPAPERDAFAEELARQLDLELERWRSYGLGPIIRRWLDHAHETGTPLRVVEADGSRLDGTFAGLDEGGALQLRLANGAMRAIHAGDVFLTGGDD